MDARTNSGARDASAGPGRATARRRPAATDSDYGLGLQAWIQVPSHCLCHGPIQVSGTHAGTSLRVRGLSRLPGGSRMDSGTEPRAVLVAQPGGGSPDGTGNRTSLTRAGRRLK